MVVAGMIVGPGETHRYLDRTLRLATMWADRIFAVTCNADADTIDALQHANVRIVGAADGPFHESNARNRLLAALDTDLADGTIVVMLDADEELTGYDGLPSAGLRSLHGPGPWNVTFYSLWVPDGSQHRVDGAWRPTPGPRIYRHQRGLRLPDRPLACPAVPDLGPATDSRLAIKHWSYARPHDRVAKHTHYMAVDGGRYHALNHLQSIVTEPVLEAMPCLN